MNSFNGVIFQFFEWYTPADGSLWNELRSKAKELSQQGMTAVWIPPCSKGSGGPIDVGYGQYDLFDLGEFDQKNSVRTKYGTKDELISAVREVQSNGMQVYADVVFNHKDGADYTEEVWVQEVSWDNRNETLSDWYPISAWTGFSFPNRNDRYSSMKWHWCHFDALSYNAITKDASKLYRIKDKHFSTEVSHEHGNFDYLLADDIDLGVDEVRGELKYWGDWFLEETGVDGFRIDAVKHIRAGWFTEWLDHLRTRTKLELFSVGEYWSGELADLTNYLDETGSVMSLFDVPLHYKFWNASRAGASFDMRTIFDDTLVNERPWKAVTFVENHDTQPCCSLESTVEPWFKPLAYALILLRREGYPCIFYGDYYGAQYSNCRGGYPVILYSHRWLIDKFLWVRRNYGFGDQHDYFDHPNTVGWVRLGDAEHPGAMAVVMSNGADGNKWMNVYMPNAIFYDLTEHVAGAVTANAEGWANFACKAGKVSVWLQQ
jgi:alpha-amylase